MVTSNRVLSKRELCGFVRGDDFIITGDSMQLAWAESRLNEGLIFTRATLGPDDATILNRLVTWVCPSGSRNQIEIEADPRHREILLAHMNLKGANVKSVTTPVMKVREWTPLMLIKLDKDGVDVQECDDSSELHVYQPRGCATGGERCSTFHGKTERGSVEHAQNVWFGTLWITAGSCR